jgi:hypothetical protein
MVIVYTGLWHSGTCHIWAKKKQSFNGDGLLIEDGIATFGTGPSGQVVSEYWWSQGLYHWNSLWLVTLFTLLAKSLQSEVCDVL